MTTTQTQLFPPPTRSNVVDVKGMLAASFRQWLFSLQYLLPLVEVDTSAGNTILALPPAGLNANTGQSNQNQEIIYVKTSADGNTVSITGAETGAIILRKQWDSARFKSDGTNWINSGVGSSSGPGAASFALLTSGENNEAAMVVGHGASLTRDADGLIDASEIGGIKIPPGSAPTTVGKVPISQGDGTAAWADPLVQGAFAPGTNADTGNGGAPINPVLGGARRTTDAELQDLSCDAANNLNVNVQASALPTGASTSANQTNGSQKSQSVDGAGNVQPAGDTPARSIQVEQTDGANVIGTQAHPVANCPGLQTLITNTPANPAAGSNWSISPPSGKQWIIQSISCTFDADATVINRIVQVRCQRPSGSFYFINTYRLPVTASQSVRFNSFAGASIVPDATSSSADLNYYASLPDGLILDDSCVLDFRANPIQAGDQWAGIVIVASQMG